MSGLKTAPPQLILGIADCFKKAGSYRYMLEQNGLTALQMAASISEVCRL
jgi:transketolase C-terminal domain/subunit